MKGLSKIDKLAATHDERIMKKWENVHKQWDTLESKLAEKVGKDPSELTFNRTNQFRERMEEYMLLDKATPIQMKYGPEYWKMSLRDNSDYTVPIGNIFSGLFCPIKGTNMDPLEIIRKPQHSVSREKSSPHHSTRSWKDSKMLKNRQNLLADKIHDMKPYNVV